MTALPLWVRRCLIGMAWILVALGLVAALLSAAGSATAEYLPILRAAMGVAGLGLGYLLGQALRPLARWRPPVPASAESAALPKDGLGHVWLRGFTAGFWVLAALGIALSLVFNLLVVTLSLGPAFPVLVYAVGVALLVPMVMARAMVARGEGLPRWTLAAAAAASFTGGIGLFLAISMLAAGLGLFLFGAASDIATLLALVVVVVVAVGTPVLARDLRPSLRGPAWSGLLALLAVGGACLLSISMGAWMSLLGPAVSWLWLLTGAVLWGGSLGALLAVAIARGPAGASRPVDSGPRPVNPLVLAAGGLGLFLLGLLPLAVWLVTIAAPGFLRPSTPPTAPIGGPNGFPDATQPGMLPIPGPALQSPPAGAILAGRLWNFTWRPPRGPIPGELYQFALWPPGAARPVTQLIIPGAGMRISSAVPRGSPSPSGPWIWRVRVVRPGQGAGQWSQARPFTPRWQ